MRRLSRVGAWAVMIALVGLTGGCGPDKLKTEKAFTIPDGADTTKIFDLPAQKVEQTIKVEVTADKPVNVFIMLAKDAPDLDGEASPEWQTKSVTFKEGATNETLTAKIPAQQATKVVITPSAKTAKAEVKVKMTN